MARARSPNSVEAEKMYRSGMKLVDIAKKWKYQKARFGAGKAHKNGMIKVKVKASVRKRKKRAFGNQVRRKEIKMQRALVPRTEIKML